MLGVSHTLSKRSTTKLYPQISDFFGLYICKNRKSRKPMLTALLRSEVFQCVLVSLGWWQLM